MPIINFSVPNSLNTRLKEIVRKKGFASKAEFFRFTAMYFMDVIDKPFVSEDVRQKYLTDELRKEIVKRYRGRHIPSVREQLRDL